MRRSGDHILTTHAGSLPRPADIEASVRARLSGQPVGPAAHAARVRQAVADVVKKQVDAGLDVVNDGEMSKPSFITYINERLGGFEIDSTRKNQSPWAGSREVADFPDFYKPQLSNVHVKHDHFVCTAPVTYRGQEQLKADLDNLKAAVAGLDVADVFVPSTSPSNVEDWNRNGFYKSEEEYVFALAEALGEEYRAIVDAGFLVQVDDPRLVTFYVLHPELSVEQCRRWAEMRVEAINHGLKGIPKEKVRYHTCYGINFGPRVHDMEVKDIVDILARLNVGAFSFEAANPRHEHEWTVWRDAKLPDDTIMIPGLITQSNVMVEHPELVAQRLGRWIGAFGPERVIAGADCGFASFAGNTEIHETIVWAKFQSLVEGARIASEPSRHAKAS
jgi:5-methyltetrahydropteroyltriglutamate--homocysteine methyltransferase